MRSFIVAWVDADRDAIRNWTSAGVASASPWVQPVIGNILRSQKCIDGPFLSMR